MRWLKLLHRRRGRMRPMNPPGLSRGLSRVVVVPFWWRLFSGEVYAWWSHLISWRKTAFDDLLPKVFGYSSDLESRILALMLRRDPFTGQGHYSAVARRYCAVR